jgi:hypothetical protein
MDHPLTALEPAPRVIYPPPPNVHWGTLFAAEIVIAMLAVMIAPKEYWSLISNLALDVWAIYLCLWLHKLDARFMSIFFCVACVVLQLAITVPSGSQPIGAGVTIAGGVLALVGLCMWIATVYLIRAELHLHYNVREPIGLYLSGVMTFFFSFLYFQYHLYKIAQLKEKYGDRPFYYQGGPSLTVPES